MRMPRLPRRKASFSVSDGHLVRTVTADTGEGYTHRCGLEEFETIADHFEAVGSSGIALTALSKGTGVPITQASVALEFLQTKGVVERKGRKNFPVSLAPHLDGMLAFHALAETP